MTKTIAWIQISFIREEMQPILGYYIDECLLPQKHENKHVKYGRAYVVFLFVLWVSHGVTMCFELNYLLICSSLVFLSIFPDSGTFTFLKKPRFAFVIMFGYMCFGTAF